MKQPYDGLYTLGQCLGLIAVLGLVLYLFDGSSANRVAPTKESAPAELKYSSIYDARGNGRVFVIDDKNARTSANTLDVLVESGCTDPNITRRRYDDVIVVCPTRINLFLEED